MPSAHFHLPFLRGVVVVVVVVVVVGVGGGCVGVGAAGGGDVVVGPGVVAVKDYMGVIDTDFISDRFWKTVAPF